MLTNKQNKYIKKKHLSTANKCKVAEPKPKDFRELWAGRALFPESHLALSCSN